MEGAQGGASSGSVSSLAVHDDGGVERLYIGGRFDDLGGSGARLLAQWDGTALMPAGPSSGIPLGGPSNQTVLSLASARRGSTNVLHVGLSSAVQTANGLSSWLVEGAGSWIGLAVTDILWGLTVQHTSGPADPVWALAGDSIIRLDGVLHPPIVLPRMSSAPWGLEWFPGAAGDGIWVGGQYAVVDGSSLGVWNGTEWGLPSPPSGMPFGVQAMGVHDFGNGPEVAIVAADFGRRPFYRFDGHGFVRQPSPPGTNRLVGSGVVSHKGDLYITSTGGGFSAGPPVVRFDGTNWQFLDNGIVLQETVGELASIDIGGGPELYIAGDFGGFSQPGTRGIARLEGQAFVSMGGGMANAATSAMVRAVEGWDDGQGPDLYAAGNFSSMGGVPAGNIARWDGNQWEALPGSLAVSAGFSSTAGIRELARAVLGGQRLLLAAGNFDLVNGHPAPGLASFDGTQWVPLSGAASDPVRLVGDVFALAVHDPDGNGDRLIAL